MNVLRELILTHARKTGVYDRVSNSEVLKDDKGQDLSSGDEIRAKVQRCFSYSSSVGKDARFLKEHVLDPVDIECADLVELESLSSNRLAHNASWVGLASCAFSKDGKQLGTLNKNKTVTLYDVPVKMSARLPGNNVNVNQQPAHLDLYPGGFAFATEKKVYIHDGQNQLQRTVDYSNYSLTALAALSATDHIASTAGGTLLGTLSGKSPYHPGMAVTTIAVSPKRKYLAIGHQNGVVTTGTINLNNTVSWLANSPPLSNIKIFALAFEGEARRLVAAIGEGGLVFLHPTRAEISLRQPSWLASHPIYSMHLPASGYAESLFAYITPSTFSTYNSISLLKLKPKNSSAKPSP